MPTYVVTTARDPSAEHKAKLVDAITTIHHVETGAPRSFVQVVFARVEPGSIFIGDEPASSDHVWVRGDIRAGRTREQKAKLLQGIARETSAIIGIPAQDVWVYVSDIPAHGMLEFGHVLPEPGGEEPWLAALPSDLQGKLRDR